MGKIDLDAEMKKIELSRLEHAMNELRYKKLERMKDIERIDDNIKIQQEAIDNKKKELEG